MKYIPEDPDIIYNNVWSKLCKRCITIYCYSNPFIASFLLGICIQVLAILILPLVWPVVLTMSHKTL